VKEEDEQERRVGGDEKMSERQRITMRRYKKKDNG